MISRRAQYLGRKTGGPRRGELVRTAGALGYSSVRTAVKRFERRLFKVPSLARVVAKAQSLLDQKQMSNAEM